MSTWGSAVNSRVKEEQLKLANAYIDGTVRLITFLSPIFARVVIEYIGVPFTIILVSFLLIVSGFTLLFIQEQRKQQRGEENVACRFSGRDFFFLYSTNYCMVRNLSSLCSIWSRRNYGYNSSIYHRRIKRELY